MAVVLFLASPTAGEPVVGPSAAASLAALGVTRISLLRDATTVGVVLEGWAFDPVRSGEAARAVFPDGTEAVRTLHEVGQLAVAATAREGRD